MKIHQKLLNISILLLVRGWGDILELHYYVALSRSRTPLLASGIGEDVLH